jgi:hypothetical protein
MALAVEAPSPLSAESPSKDPNKRINQVAPRQIKLPGKDNSDKEAEDERALGEGVRCPIMG